MKKSQIIKILGILPLLSLGLFLKHKQLDPLISESFPCLKQRQSQLLGHEVVISRRNLKQAELLHASHLLEQKQFLQGSEALCQLSLDQPIKKVPFVERLPASLTTRLGRNCQEEAFFEHGADGASARQFLHPQIHALNFSLKSDLGCIKDQGNRNTALAFATIGAVEMQARSGWEMKLNMSEQHFYASAKLNWLPTGWSSPRYYGDALPGVLSLQQATKEAYQFRPGSSWRYNPSGQRLLTTYPTNFYSKSCENYNGPCSNTNHQARIASCPMGMLNDSYMWCRYQLPEAKGVGLRIKSIQALGADASALDLTKIILSQQPLLTTLLVSRAFLESKETLIEGQEKEELFGGHQVLVVGFIDSSALPAELEARSKGYYLVKNSWGENWGWRGYGLVSEDYFKSYSGGLIQLSLSRSRPGETR